MSILLWIVVGAVSGWIAGLIMKGSGSGFLMNIVIGVAGAFVGGLLMSLIGQSGVSGFNIWSFIVSIIGAIVLLAVVNLFRKKK